MRAHMPRSLALVLLAAAAAAARPLAAQTPPSRPEPADTVLRSPTRGDTTRAADSARARAPRLADPVDRLLAGMPARHLGPALFGGRVTSLAVPRPYRGTVYVGTAGGGVWKTVNRGVTWRPVSDSTGALSVGDVAVAPSDTNVVWLGTGEKNSLRSQGWGNGVWRSTDGGRTWAHAGLANTRAVGRVVVHPRDPNTAWVAALGHLWAPNPERGVYKTADGGRTWARTLFVNDTAGAVELALDPSNPDVLYAGTWHRVRWGGTRVQGVGAGSGIHKSTDGGRTWRRLTDPALKNGLPAGQMGRIGLAVSARRPRTVYAMIQVDRGVVNAGAQPFGGVYRSDDAGATWRHVHDFQANPHYYYDDVWVDPSDAEHLWVSSMLLMESKDGGRTFAPESLSNVHVDHHALWVDPDDPRHHLLGNDGGLYESFDGGRAWLHHAIPVAQAYTVTIDSAVAPYGACAGFQDNGSWCVPTQTRDTLGIGDDDWMQVGGGDGMWVSTPPGDPHTVYSSYQFGALSRLDLRTGRRDPLQPVTVDAGSEGGYPLTFGWTAPLVQSQHDSATFYFGANRLVRFTRGGRDWELLGPDMTRADRTRPAPDTGSTSYHALFSIAEGPRDRNLLWTGSDDGLIWVSRDAGRTWAEVSRNLPAGAPRACFVGTLVASRHAAGTAYAALDCHHRDDYRPYLYATRDFGATWQPLGTGGLPGDGGSHTVAEHPVNPGVLFAGTERGAYASVDGGATWRRFPRALPPVPVLRFAAHPGQRDLILATHGRGLWTVNVAALDSLTPATLAEPARLFAVPAAYASRLVDTRPSAGSRPFFAPNPPRGAPISYWLRDAQAGPVRLTVTDARGDTVRTIQGPGYAGLQRAQWDGMRDKPRPRAMGEPTTPFELRTAGAGAYTVTMTVAGVTMRQPVVLREWPADRRGRFR
jgi:photosystem II stability/assembly factor-like uncharacterized protein